MRFKGFLGCGALFFSCSLLLAGEFTTKNFKVEITDNAESLEVVAKTRKMYPSLCGMDAMTLQIEKKSPTQSSMGKIAVTFARREKAPCRKVFGYETGSLFLKKGLRLPNVSAGIYQVYVDGELVTDLEVK